MGNLGYALRDRFSDLADRLRLAPALLAGLIVLVLAGAGAGVWVLASGSPSPDAPGAVTTGATGPGARTGAAAGPAGKSGPDGKADAPAKGTPGVIPPPPMKVTATGVCKSDIDAAAAFTRAHTFAVVRASKSLNGQYNALHAALTKDCDFTNQDAYYNTIERFWLMPPTQPAAPSAPAKH